MTADERSALRERGRLARCRFLKLSLTKHQAEQRLIPGRIILHEDWGEQHYVAARPLFLLLWLLQPCCSTQIEPY